MLSIAANCQKIFISMITVFFQGMPTKVLYGGERIELGNRTIEVIHTPGHSPGHICFWEKEKGYLFTGDLVYKGTLAAWFPSTDPTGYLKSLEAIAVLPVKKNIPCAPFAGSLPGNGSSHEERIPTTESRRKTLPRKWEL